MATTEVALERQTKGTLPVAEGGTSKNSLGLNNILIGNGTSAVAELAPGVDGQAVGVAGGVFSLINIPVANYFSVDGGSASTSFIGTLKIDFGGAT